MRFAPDTTPRDHMISVRGRDATADLVDCSAPSKPGEWQDSTLDQITRGLVAPFGFECHGRDRRGRTVHEISDR